MGTHLRHSSRSKSRQPEIHCLSTVFLLVVEILLSKVGGGIDKELKLISV